MRDLQGRRDRLQGFLCQQALRVAVGLAETKMDRDE